ncbi:MAG: redox-sensing transcriptional repressor Rex [Bacillota bacterium]
MAQRKVPDVVIRRLPLYLRALEILDPDESPIISSEQLAKIVGSSSGQVRKDLSYFGVFGKQGVGYQTLSLRAELRRVLKLNREIRVGLIGAGNLGAALVRYHQKNKVHQPLEIVALFDIDEKKIGRKIAEVEVYHPDLLPKIIRELDIKMMILTFPALNVQEMVDVCIENGVKSFLNFVPASIKTPADVKLRTSDVTLELQSLAYYT